MPTEEAITEWIESTERKFRQFNDPGRWGQPPPNPGNGMWRDDARKWAGYTPEQKREMALMNLAPYKIDPVNAALCDSESRDRNAFNSATGRYRPYREERLLQ